jgi:hypothetical protein
MALPISVAHPRILTIYSGIYLDHVVGSFPMTSGAADGKLIAGSGLDDLLLQLEPNL